ncbi:oral-facial-digital syndrome 1 protein isoform X2 [Eutrema salsugineum]|uniref:oral-facial-digital syndrome 1 protein isoform X2 n=1 Tax=Eutrema salsugineum TaxID=72664 RepID=UPI000CED71F3|nr:oral-facial-digital syndrome 1 protein isoform X2 [Eutrema salsugineum]
MAGNADTSAQDSLSEEALEMWNHEMKSGQLRVDNLQADHVDFHASLEEGSEEDARDELGVLLGRVKSAAASLRYLRSKARILTVPGEDTLTGTSMNQDSLVIEGGAYTWKMLQSIQMVTDVLESLLRRVTAAESETSFQKERVVIGEEEIRRKTVQIENLSLRLEEMKEIVRGNKAVLDETVEIIKKLVEDSRRDREKAVENEEELRRVKAECESLRNYVNTSTSVRETLASSERQLEIIEARLVARSTQLEGEKAQKEVEVQKLMEENVKLTALLDKKEAQLLALNEQCKVMALNASNI